ncbi:hypothetical protein BU16DRAFT_589416 [Lophium mytilinum]|uniref:Uncharacterized protein n=1 Tax=Lophium mytilinum TaxID=390894 RepID=A0A6A6QQR4_9PEZI|nr:hypothetical protein BU16DRAFT_589416 [Lophium mytilinum]
MRRHLTVHLTPPMAQPTGAPGELQFPWRSYIHFHNGILFSQSRYHCRYLTVQQRLMSSLALSDRLDNGLPHRGNPASPQHTGCFWNVHAAALCKLQGSSTTEIHPEMRHAAYQEREAEAGPQLSSRPRLTTRFGSLGVGIWDQGDAVRRQDCHTKILNPTSPQKPACSTPQNLCHPPPACVFDAAERSGRLRSIVAATNLAHTNCSHRRRPRPGHATQRAHHAAAPPIAGAWCGARPYRSDVVVKALHRPFASGRRILPCTEASAVFPPAASPATRGPLPLIVRAASLKPSLRRGGKGRC